MKNWKIAIISFFVVLGTAVPDTNNKLRYSWDSGIQWNGKWAASTLQGYDYQKRVSACVGVCTTSVWIEASEYTAHVKDLGGYFDTAYTHYDYK